MRNFEFQGFDDGGSNIIFKVAHPYDGGGVYTYPDISMTLDKHGRLAVGTEALPTYQISLRGSPYTGQTHVGKIGMERNLFTNDNGQNMYLIAGGATVGATNKNGGDLYIQSGTATGNGSSNIQFQTVAAGQGAGTTDRTPTTKMTILGSGYVGIGEASPDNLLHVTAGQGIIKLESTTADTPSILRLDADNVANNVEMGRLEFNADGLIGGQISMQTGTSTASGRLIFSTRQTAVLTEVMRLDEAGNVGIGTTATAGEKLEINGNVKVTGRYISNVTANTTYNISFASTNIVRTTVGGGGACGTLVISGTQPGGTYTLTMPSVNTTCTINGAGGSPTTTIDGLTFKLPTGYSPGATATGGVVYTLINDGSNVWISYVPF